MKFIEDLIKMTKQRKQMMRFLQVLMTKNLLKKRSLKMKLKKIQIHQNRFNLFRKRKMIRISHKVMLKCPKVRKQMIVTTQRLPLLSHHPKNHRAVLNQPQFPQTQLPRFNNLWSPSTINLLTLKCNKVVSLRQLKLQKLHLSCQYSNAM